jgi:hypothetical protein
MSSVKNQKSLLKTNPISAKPVKKVIMRKNQKVARVSLCCKLNMLVPHLQNLSSRMQAEALNEKGRSHSVK